MTSQAHVLVAAGDGDVGAVLTHALASRRCLVHSVPPEGDVVTHALAAGPHVAVLAAEDGLATARLLKGDSRTAAIPIVLAALDGGDGLRREALAAGIEDVVISGRDELELFTRVRALVRLGVMRSELVRRDMTRGHYGLPTETAFPVSQRAGVATVLAAGELGREFEAVQQAVGRASYLAYVGDPQGAMAELTGGNFDAAVVGIDDAGPWLELCHEVRDNAQLFNLPILMIADADRLGDVAAAYESGASDLLFRPVVTDELRARLDLLVRQQRYRKTMQAAYRRSLHVETGDSLTGLYNFGYLHDYLTSLIADCERWGRELSIGMFDVAGMAAINRDHGYAGGDRLLRQVGGLIARLVRGEDLTARYGGGEFCVVMAETGRDDARRVLARIASIVARTAFGIPGCAESVTVRLKSSAAEMAPGDTAEGLIERARTALA